MTEKKAHFSFTKSLYDDCNLVKKEQESTGPYQYIMDPIRESQDSCWQNQSPFMHNHFNSIPLSHVDVESDLRNQTRHASKCPGARFDPTKLDNCRSCKNCNNGLPCDCKHCRDTKYENSLKDCSKGLIPTYTRMNRSCNVLSGVTINRFETLHEDPQDMKKIQSNAFIGSNTRLEVKDTFKSTQEKQLNKQKLEQLAKDEQHAATLAVQTQKIKQREREMLDKEYGWSWSWSMPHTK